MITIEIQSEVPAFLEYIHGWLNSQGLKSSYSSVEGILSISGEFAEIPLYLLLETCVQREPDAPVKPTDDRIDRRLSEITKQVSARCKQLQQPEYQ